MRACVAFGSGFRRSTPLRFFPEESSLRVLERVVKRLFQS